MNTTKKETTLLDKAYQLSQDIAVLKEKATIILDEAKKLEEERKDLVKKGLTKLKKKSIENDLIILTLQKNRMNINIDDAAVPEEYMTLQPDKDRIKKETKKMIEEAEMLNKKAPELISGVSVSYTELDPKITLRTKESQ